jgi:hypothetical protein
MISGKDVEGNGRGLILSTILEFVTYEVLTAVKVTMLLSWLQIRNNIVTMTFA